MVSDQNGVSSTMIYSQVTPFWSETLEIIINTQKL